MVPSNNINSTGLNKKAKSKPKKIYNENYLYDLNKTMQINLKMILDITKVLEMNQKNKNLILKRIKIISKLFDKYQSLRKEMLNIKSKNLVNYQIYGEIKRRICETTKFYDDRINDINNAINKKLIYLKKDQKKFKEIQIYIRRESQDFFKYKKMFANFLINPFILENESLIRYKNKLNKDLDIKNNIINTLNNEIVEIKERKKIKSLQKENTYITNNYKSVILSKIPANDKLNNYLLGLQEKIKFDESLNLKLIKKKIVYQRKVISNNFIKEINNLKNRENIINTDFSQEISNHNDISVVSFNKKTNNDDNLESNISNSVYEIFNTEDIKKNTSSFLQDLNNEI